MQNDAERTLNHLHRISECKSLKFDKNLKCLQYRACTYELHQSAPATGLEVRTDSHLASQSGASPQHGACACVDTCTERSAFSCMCITSIAHFVFVNLQLPVLLCWLAKCAADGAMLTMWGSLGGAVPAACAAPPAAYAAPHLRLWLWWHGA